jgi:hypothetical protein
MYTIKPDRPVRYFIVVGVLDLSIATIFHECIFIRIQRFFSQRLAPIDAICDEARKLSLRVANQMVWMIITEWSDLLQFPGINVTFGFIDRMAAVRLV